MHLLTLHELRCMHLLRQQIIEKIVPEQDVLLQENHGKSERKGRFDFLVHCRDGSFLGIEVLARPTQGKLKEKLAYANETDEFVFVLPSDALTFYRKTKTKPFKKLTRGRFLDSEFLNPRVKAWLLNLKEHRFEEKGRFSEMFNVRH